MPKSLKEHRAAANLTQAELAEKAGICSTQITGYERGRQQPSLRTLNRLAGALGVQIGDIALPEKAA